MASITRNTIYTLAGAITPVALTIVILPFYLDSIGIERYGLIATIWAITSYFSISDLGIGRAVSQRIAKSNGNSEQQKQILGNAFLLNAALGLIGAILLQVTVTYFFAEIAKTNSTELRLEAIACTPWIAAMIPVIVFRSTLVGTLQGLQQFKSLGACNIFATALAQLLPLIAAKTISPSLEIVVAAIFAARCCSLTLLGLLTRSALTFTPQIMLSRQTSTELLRYGGWISITALLSPILVVSDRFILGATAGATAVAFYSIPFSLVTRLFVLPTSIVSVLFPNFAAAPPLKRTKLSESALQAIAGLMTPLTVVLMLSLQTILTHWLDNNIAEESTIIGVILLAGVFINSFARVPFTEIQAAGNPEIVTRLISLQIIPYLLILYPACIQFGAIGAATVWSTRVTVDALFLFTAGNGTSLKSARFAIPHAVLVIASAIVSCNFQHETTTYWLTAAFLTGATIRYSWRTLPESIKERVSRFQRHITPIASRTSAP